MKVVCVAVIGKNNNPLYIRSFDTTEDGLKFHYIVHSSLDVVEEKLAGKKAAPSADMYMGLLYPTEDYKVYGYITNTRVKLIAVILDDTDVKEADIKSFFLGDFILSTATQCATHFIPLMT